MKNRLYGEGERILLWKFIKKFPVILLFLFPITGWSQLLIAPRDTPTPSITAEPIEIDSTKIINDIIIKGNLRSDPTTILSYLPFTLGDRPNTSIFDSALKALYATGNFFDITITQEGNDVIVTVQEYPVINIISFEGNKILKDDILAQETLLRPLQPLTKAKAKRDVERITNLYRQVGKLNSTVDAKIIELDQNRVNLVYEIREGRKTTIDTLTFVGNRFYSDKQLREKLRSRENSFWRFGASKNYNSARVNFDKELLRRFYINNGFADIEILTAIAELTPDWQSFNISYLVRENTRYHVGDIHLENKISGMDVVALQKIITKSSVQKGALYAFDDIRDLSEAITERANRLGFPFTDTAIQLNRDQENGIMNISVIVEPQQRRYVERINIFGNTTTFDSVIRRHLLFSAGDPLIQSLLNQSQRRLGQTGFFSSVNITTEQGSTPARSIINVTVEESSTGTLNFAVGYSNVENALIRLGFGESNFRGRGQIVKFSLNVSRSRTNAELSISEPYFLNKPIRGSVSIFNTDLNDSNDTYDLNDRGISLGLGYRLSEKWFQNFSTRWTRRVIDSVETGAPVSIQGQEGTVGILELGQRLSYNNVDNPRIPHKGFHFSVSTTHSDPSSDVKYNRVTSNATAYFPLSENTTWVFRLNGGIIKSIEPSLLRISERFQIGGSLLKGFRRNGVGPRDLDSNTPLGGEEYITGTSEFRFPLGFPQETGVSGFVFYNAGVLKRVDPESQSGNYVDSASIRDATGYGMLWRSPIGPFRFEWLQPRRFEDYDITESFEFTIGTEF